jgi:hypothetical protein
MKKLGKVRLIYIGIQRQVKSGIVLNERGSHDKPYWRDMRDIELMRRYDWGEIHCCWGASMQNVKVEQHIYSSMEILDKELTKIFKEVYKIELDYIFPIDEFKKNVLLGVKDD